MSDRARLRATMRGGLGLLALLFGVLSTGCKGSVEAAGAGDKSAAPTAATAAPPAASASATAPAKPVDLAAKAVELADRLIVLDGHIDVPWRIWKSRDAKGNYTEDVGEATAAGDFDYPRAKRG